jgi:glycosyltransferase involved in cell wall biosynthesis
MKITLSTPTLNEAQYIRAWIEQGLTWADEIIVCDTGSTDGTLDIVSEYRKVKLIQMTVDSPYQWQEGEIRNKMKDFSSHEWICNLDADELWDSSFLDLLPDLRRSHAFFHRFIHNQYWLTPQTIRLKQIKRGHFPDWYRRFYPSTQIRLFRNIPSIAYRNMGNHAFLEYEGLGKWSARLGSRTHSVPFHHYHYCLLNKGPAQSRHEDINRSGIKLQTYFEGHPIETKFYDWFPARRLDT